MDDLVQACERLWPRGISIFVSHEARFRNPLTPADREALAGADVVRDPAVTTIVADRLASRVDRLERGTYFPAPLARAVAAGRAFDEVVMSFHYPLISVDADQRWEWKGRPVANRIRRFFKQHLGFEEALGVYFVEYRVNDDWWDKCYLDCVTTPLVATRIRDRPAATGNGEAVEVVADLDNGRRDTLDPDSLRLDAQERLFASSERHGPVRIADAPRFALLRTVSEDCRTVELAGRRRLLHWPEPAAESPACRG